MKNMLPEKLLRVERTLYTLHTRINAKWVKGSGFKEECNQYYMGVQPDHGGGITEADAEEVAKEIEIRYNSFLELRERNERMQAALSNLVDKVEKLSLWDKTDTAYYQAKKLLREHETTLTHDNN